MGRYALTGEVHGTRSAHNSPQDALDKAAWARFWKTVEALAALPDFEALGLDVWWTQD